MTIQGHPPESKPNSARHRVRPPADARLAGLRRGASWNLISREDLEDRSAYCGFSGLVDVDLVDIANEPPTKSRRSRDRSNHIANEFNRLGLPQFHRDHVLLPSSYGDRCSTGCTQVAHPICFAKRADHTAPAAVIADRHRSCSWQARLAAANRDQHVGAHRYSDG